MIRKFKRLLITLEALSLILLGGVAQAALPATYQLGLSQSVVDTLINKYDQDETGTLYARDYRDIKGDNRAEFYEKPTAQFEILSNGKVVATSDAGRNLDAPTVVAELNINDDITIRDKSSAYKGKLCFWDLQKGQGVLMTK